jgi:hypothetical protein
MYVDDKFACIVSHVESRASCVFCRCKGVRCLQEVVPLFQRHKIQTRVEYMFLLIWLYFSSVNVTCTVFTLKLPST